MPLDWDALESAGEDRLVDRITTTWKTVARDHKQTFRMLALHPPVEHIINNHEDSPPTATDDTERRDPTGEAALSGNEARRRQEWYSQLLAEVDARVDVLDSIRRQMMPAREAPPHVDDNWCKNCITAGICNDRRDRYHYCKWCISIRQAYGSLPPPEIVKLRDETGDSMRVAKAIDEWRKRR